MKRSAQGAARIAIKVAHLTVNTAVGLAMMLAFAVGVYGLWDNHSIAAQAGAERLKAYSPEAGGPGFAELKEINPDVKGWLKIYGTKIDYPVVKAAHEWDYLNRDVFGNFSLAGSLFYDSKSAADLSTWPTIIYGHHMADNIMFGALDEFSDPEFFEAHQYGTYYVDGREYGLEILGNIATDAYNVPLYRPASSREEYTEMILGQLVNRRSVDLAGARGLLVFSTCASGASNARTVVVAAVSDAIHADPYAEVANEGEGILASSWFGLPKLAWAGLAAALAAVLILVWRRRRDGGKAGGDAAGPEAARPEDAAAHDSEAAASAPENAGATVTISMTKTGAALAVVLLSVAGLAASPATAHADEGETPRLPVSQTYAWGLLLDTTYCITGVDEPGNDRCFVMTGDEETFVDLVPSGRAQATYVLAPRTDLLLEGFKATGAESCTFEIAREPASGRAAVFVKDPATGAKQDSCSFEFAQTHQWRDELLPPPDLQKYLPNPPTPTPTPTPGGPDSFSPDPTPTGPGRTPSADRPSNPTQEGTSRGATATSPLKSEKVQTATSGSSASFRLSKTGVAVVAGIVAVVGLAGAGLALRVGAARKGRREN